MQITWGRGSSLAEGTVMIRIPGLPLLLTELPNLNHNLNLAQGSVMIRIPGLPTAVGLFLPMY